MKEKVDKEKWKNFKDLKPIEKRKQPTFTYPDGEILKGKILDEVTVDSKIIDENTTGKVYRNLLQLIKWEDEREDFRFCYYYINFSNKRTYWIWGQYGLSISKEGFKELLAKMKEKGWL